MTTGKTIALTRWILAGKAISLLFNMFTVVKLKAGEELMLLNCGAGDDA